MNPTLNAQEDLREQETPIAVPAVEPVQTPQQFAGGFTVDNQITNNLVDQGSLPESQREIFPQQNFVQADQGLVSERDRVFSQLQDTADRPTFEREFQGQLRGLGTPEAVTQLQDVQQQLQRLNTQFDLQGSRIAEGSSIGQAQREVSQNERERAIRTAGLAAQAQLLQGNIETAQSIARDTVNFAFQDEQLRLNQLGRQYDALQDRVSGQEAQLLEQRRVELAQEQDQLENLRDNVANAVTSGVATADEMTQLTNQAIPAEERVALAQQITARGAAQLQARERAESAARMANIYSQIADRERIDEQGNQFNTVNGQEQTSTQIQAQGYAERMDASHRIINDIGGEFTSRLAIGGLLPNEVQTANRQQFEQAKRNFVNAVLRRESGAAIAESEFQSAEAQYFPMAGDSDEVLVQKAANRESVINNMFQQANVFRPVVPNDIIESEGVRYQVGADGQTLTPIE